MKQLNPIEKKRKKGLETTQKILEVSAQLIASKGFDSVTTREIAKNVGIKDSSLYNHFSSKAQILEALFEYYGENTAKAWPTMDEIEKMMSMMKPIEIMKIVLYRVNQSIDATIANITRIIFTERFRNPVAAELYFKVIVDHPVQFYTDIFNRMIEKGMIKKIDAKTYAEQFNYVSVALTMEYFMAHNGFGDINSATQNLIKNILFFFNLIEID